MNPGKQRHTGPRSLVLRTAPLLRQNSSVVVSSFQSASVMSSVAAVVMIVVASYFLVSYADKIDRHSASVLASLSTYATTPVGAVGNA